MTHLPTLFISHGAPTFALEPGEAGRELRQLAASLPKPAAILIASPHWISPVLAVSSAAMPETLHDFAGFPDPLYRLRYPAPGSPALAERARALLRTAGIGVQADGRRGLDHGAWVPLMHMYPDADIPVVQLSMPPQATAAQLHALGRALAPMRTENVLIVGSGSITHNLYEFGGMAASPEPYVAAFTNWIADTLAAGDLAALLDYRRLAPHAPRAHPTDEHLTPLMFAYGAAGERPATRRLASSDVRYGMLAMDAYVFRADA